MNECLVAKSLCLRRRSKVRKGFSFRPMQDAKAEAVLIQIAQEFPIAIVGLQLLPEAGDIARAMHGGSAIAAAMVR